MADSVVEGATTGEVAYDDEVTRIAWGLARLFSERLHEDAERYARGYGSKNEDVLVRIEHLVPALGDAAKFMERTPFKILLKEIRRLDEEDGIGD